MSSDSLTLFDLMLHWRLRWEVKKTPAQLRHAEFKSLWKDTCAYPAKCGATPIRSDWKPLFKKERVQGTTSTVGLNQGP
jgi:hypothetical protein